MLYGYPPFSSDSRQTTKLRIVNWRQTLRFPSKPRISTEARDLLERLICDHQNRLGANGAGAVKAHPFFKTIDWATLRSSQPPWTPALQSPTDTSCFEDIPPEKAVPMTTSNRPRTSRRRPATHTTRGVLTGPRRRAVRCGGSNCSAARHARRPDQRRDVE